MVSQHYQSVYAVVKEIPEGKVATYGQVSQLAGYPNGARQVGYALSSLPAENDVPWHRVVNVKGEISPRTSSEHDRYQRILLEDEGIEFDLNGKIFMKVFLWQP